MSELDLITFVGISESWHAFDVSRFNMSFSISAFEILLNLKYFFVLLLFIATVLGWFLLFYYTVLFLSCYWILNMVDIYYLSWYFRIFRFETTSIKILLRTSATLSFLSKINSCSTNGILLWVEPFSAKKAEYISKKFYYQ